MNNQDYFAKDFDPNKVTIKRLKEILNAHNIPHKDISRKAEFVQKFQDHVIPDLQRRREEGEPRGATELQQERKTAKDHRVRRNVIEQRHAEQEIIPSSQTKTPNQRKKKSGRASNKKQKEETITQPYILQDDGQSSKATVIDDNHAAQLTSISQSSGHEQSKQNYSGRLSPPRPLKAPMSETPFYPMVPPYPRTPVYPFLEPEELETVRRKDQELQQSSERQETPLYPIQEGSENGEDKIKYFERREAFAYCFKPRAPKRDIDRRPPPEFIKRKNRIRLSSGIVILSFIFIFIFLYLSLKTKIGFCDSVVKPIPDHKEVGNVQSLIQLLINIMCTHCPPKATCSNGVIAECEKGFKQETSFFRLTKPYYTHCAIDKEQTTKAKKYTKEFKELVAREMGRVTCGYGDNDNLLYENLKLQLKEKMPPQDYKYINDIDENITKIREEDQENDIYVEEENEDSISRLYIFSKKPTYSFYCQLTFAFVNLIENIFDNLFYSLTVVLTSSLLLFGTLYIRQWIWEKRQISTAFGLALTRLNENKRIIGLEFREEAFSHVKNPMVRQKLFQKLDEKVRTNPYVRAGNTRYDGFEAGFWEWKAPSTSHVNSR
ncbi:Man1-Src1p-C-terminal domain-containing protein [Glomus cerebriforme]|uniref:Man1-Src1p-C-terminal domain-containing protein n=1 Tax=Glomus cerebriforme TaxID=658196 RepID=A0A397SSM6_9GLOM|nr:Man1-Src1p-C-terminal domain-containing protein [Glomus cerebriforme]